MIILEKLNLEFVASDESLLFPKVRLLEAGLRRKVMDYVIYRNSRPTQMCWTAVFVSVRSASHVGIHCVHPMLCLVEIDCGLRSRGKMGKKIV